MRDVTSILRATLEECFSSCRHPFKESVTDDGTVCSRDNEIEEGSSLLFLAP